MHSKYKKVSVPLIIYSMSVGRREREKDRGKEGREEGSQERKEGERKYRR